MARMALCLCFCAMLLCPAPAATRPSFLPPEIETALKQKVSGRLIKAPLHETIVQYAKLAGVPIRADWDALKDVGVGKDTKVVLRVSEITMENLLDLTLADISPKDHHLAWYVDDNAIRITTQRRVLFPKSVPSPAGVREAPSSREKATTQPASRARGRLRKIDFRESSLEDVLTFLRDVSGASFHVNWKALAASAINKETPVTVQAENITVSKALDLVTEQLGTGLGKLDRVYWLVDEGVVMISTGTLFNRKLRTRIYDVGDLLVVTENFRGPRMNLEVRPGSSGNSGGSRSIWQTEGERDGPSRAELRKANEEKLIDVIKTTIGEEMWEPIGKGTIKIFRNRLIISQTPLGFKMMEKTVGKNWILRGR